MEAVLSASAPVARTPVAEPVLCSRVAVAMLVYRDDAALLMRNPGDKVWNLPIRHVQAGKDPVIVASRSLYRATGLATELFLQYHPLRGPNPCAPQDLAHVWYVVEAVEPRPPIVRTLDRAPLHELRWASLDEVDEIEPEPWRTIVAWLTRH